MDVEQRATLLTGLGEYPGRLMLQPMRPTTHTDPGIRLQTSKNTEYEAGDSVLIQFLSACGLGHVWGAC